MTSVDEHARAIERMLAGPLGLAGTGTGAETVPLSDALGRITAIDVSAAVDLPLFRNSQMDGFAARAADLVGAPVTLPVAGDIPAGHAQPPALVPGTVTRIMTGAIVPDGADCVVPVEDTRLSADPGFADPARPTGAPLQRSSAHPSPSRLRGSPETSCGNAAAICAAVNCSLPAGQRLAPRHLAALAAGGQNSVLVLRRVRVAVITTGAELAPAGAALASGQIFDANLVALSAAVTEAGAELVLAESSSDDTGEFLSILTRATRAADLVVTSGGVSQGAYEVVREALEPLGAVVGHVDMQPGGPQATAVVDGVPVVCFPGNPVSTQVSFVVFLRPILRRAAGLPALPPTARRLAGPVASVAGKRQFLRGRMLDDGTVETVAGAGSHLVAAMAACRRAPGHPPGDHRPCRGAGRGSVGTMTELTHLDGDGRARMIDVGQKAETTRAAVARARFVTTAEVLALVRAEGLPKADVLATARIAGISGAKKTSELIPLCHQVALSSVTVDFELGEDSIEIEAVARTRGQTGVEMEALTAVAIAGLTLHDMVKAVDPAAMLTEVRLEQKSGGKRGNWQRSMWQRSTGHAAADASGSRPTPVPPPGAPRASSSLRPAARPASAKTRPGRSSPTGCAGTDTTPRPCPSCRMPTSPAPSPKRWTPSRP